MPIYEFRCRECGKVSDFILNGSSDGKKPACLGCGSRNLEKLISTPSLMKHKTNPPGTTCCGRTERCETPPCSESGSCCHG